MNHKAQFDLARKSIYWLIAGVIITAVVFSFAVVIAQYKNNLTKIPPELDAELIALRFVNLPECFAYFDSETNSLHSGVIDLAKFSPEQMLKCYRTDAQTGIKTLNFRLKLKGLNQEVVTNNYFNKDDFTLFKEVLVKSSSESSDLVPDQLIIYVQEKI